MWIHVQTLILVDSLSFLFLTFLIPIILIIRAGSGHIASANRTEESLKEGARGRGGQSPEVYFAYDGKPWVNPPTHSCGGGARSSQEMLQERGKRWPDNGGACGPQLRSVDLKYDKPLLYRYMISCTFPSGKASEEHA